MPIEAGSTPTFEIRGSSLLVRAGALTGVVDAIFSSVLVVVFYHSTVGRLWRGVASVPFGKTALEGGSAMTLVGLLLHFCVAFWWSAVFLFIAGASSGVRKLIRSPAGILAAAVVYGPLIWMVMSFGVIPFFVHRPPSITFRWWVQLIGHIPFVAFPIVATIARGRRAAHGS
ncbi:MAG: hypothetical protein ACRD16_10965 [Thermoanaerobaculia bacterium]